MPRGISEEVSGEGQGVFVDVDDDVRTIGARLRRIRNSRKKGLRVTAGLGKSKLSCIERGEIALDSISDIVALANALQISPSELTTLPMPAPENAAADTAVEAVRHTLIGGQPSPARWPGGRRGRAAGPGTGGAERWLPL
jgi:transcriptional regulator with XRE-family HTH domain